MFAAVSNKVIELHRTKFADFELENLKEGEFKIIKSK